MSKFNNIVIDTFSKVLNIRKKEINIKSKFEDLENFDSLNYVKIILEISKKIDINLPIDELAELKTINGLIKLISKYH